MGLSDIVQAKKLNFSAPGVDFNGPASSSQWWRAVFLRILSILTGDLP
jgi:hypothetical protein